MKGGSSSLLGVIIVTLLPGCELIAGYPSARPYADGGRAGAPSRPCALAGTELGTPESPVVFARIPAPRVDGEVDAPWCFSPPYSLLGAAGAPADEIGLTVRLGWSAEGVHFLAEAQDDELNADAPFAYQNDHVALYIDPTGTPTSGLEGDETVAQLTWGRRDITVPENTPSRDLAASLFAQRDTPSGWTAELSLPWTDLGLREPPLERALVLVDVAVGDRDADGELSTLRWFATGDTARNSGRWGHGVLSP